MDCRTLSKSGSDNLKPKMTGSTFDQKRMTNIKIPKVGEAQIWNEKMGDHDILKNKMF